MIKYLFAVLLLVTLCPYSFGQTDVKLDKSLFKNDKEGFSDAWSHVKEGNRLYHMGTGMMADASEHYRIALEYNPGYASLLYKLGVTCLLSGNTDDAIEYFLRAVELSDDLPNDIMLLTGRAYMEEANFGKAIDCFNIYSDRMVNSDDFDIRVNQYIRESNQAIEMKSKPSGYMAENLGKYLNSPGDDYSPVVSPDGSVMYFTSRRSSESGSRNNQDMKWNESIYVSTIEDGIWGEPKTAGKNLATDNNEGVLAYDSDNMLLYVYSGWAGNGDIYVSYYKKGEWKSPEPIDKDINTPSRETSIALTASNDEIFFTSDRKKGIGGRDVYYIRQIKKNRWTKPFNLGPSVNSVGNEEAVWVSAAGDTLYFSSNGRDGMGGYDIYMSVKSSEGKWENAVNLGVPINSQSNDLFYRPLPGSLNQAVMASDRRGGEGGFDIYRIIASQPDTTIIKPVGVSDSLRLR